MKFHAASTIFPMMNKEELAALEEDIRQNGLLEPIVIFNGEVLDGRNRITVCNKLGITPKTTEFHRNGVSEYEFVLSRNLHRRHLTQGQLATIAAIIADEMAQDNKKKRGMFLKGFKSHGTSSVDVAAKMFRVAKKQVSNAMTLKRHAADLFNEARSGKKVLHHAYKEYRSRARPSNSRHSMPITKIELGPVIVPSNIYVSWDEIWTMDNQLRMKGYDLSIQRIGSDFHATYIKHDPNSKPKIGCIGPKHAMIAAAREVSK